MYDRYSAVTAEGAHNFLRLRKTVLLRKEARKMFVQANTRVKGQLRFLDSVKNDFFYYRTHCYCPFDCFFTKFTKFEINYLHAICKLITCTIKCLYLCFIHLTL